MFSYLINKRIDDVIEAPTVAYINEENKMLEFTSCFGVSRSIQSELKLPHYYFTNYENAINTVKKGGQEGGIIRFAIFLGSMLTNISDVETFKYDSVYISNPYGPYWGLKEYEQQVVLTIHHVNKKDTSCFIK